MKKQVILIKWGEVKENFKDFYDFLEKQDYDPYKEKKKRWNRNLDEQLWDGFEVLVHEVFDKYFADYKSWKICFEKMIPYFKDDLIFIWHSLWWTFLSKYLNEEKNIDFFDKIKKIILVAPAFEDIKGDLIWTFEFDKKLINFKKIKDKIIILASKDDPVVPFFHGEKFKEILISSKFIISENNGHFLWEKYPEIIEEIKS